MSRPSALHLVLLAWVSLCGAGMWQLVQHATTPGLSGTVMTRLADDIARRLDWSREQPLLLVAAHPQCSCLPSTLDQLAVVLENERELQLRVLVFEPATPPRGWDRSARDTLCRGLPERAVVVDTDGELSRRLGAQTSGHVLLYAPSTNLVFSGGITQSRGHVGENTASRKLRSLLHSDPIEATHTAVFGCAMHDDANN